MRFSIFLIVFDPSDLLSHPEALPKTIESIFILEGPFDVIIVNANNPYKTPKTTKFLRSVAKNTGFNLIEMDKNYGCGGSFNKAVRSMSSVNDILVYMSPDAFIIDPKMICKIADAFGSNLSIGAIHPLSNFEDFNKCNYSKDWSADSFRNLLKNSGHTIENLPHEPMDEIYNILKKVEKNKKILDFPMPQLPLTFYAIKRDVFFELNGFNEEFMAGYENIDIAIRAYQKGYKSAILRNTFIYHRRLIFRIFGSAGENEVILKTHLNNGALAWNRIWQGQSQDEVFCDIRYGKLINRMIIKPIKKIKRIIKTQVKKI